MYEGGRLIAPLSSPKQHQHPRALERLAQSGERSSPSSDTFKFSVNK
jgi:hypothetical protein